MHTEFAQFKYLHDDGAMRSTARRWFVGVMLGLALILLVRIWPLGIAAFIVALIAWWGVSPYLLLGPRYMLCGTTIVYYANVKSLTLSRSAGTLRVQSNNGKTFVLVRDKFPTNARKPEKITMNKAAKFDKVVDKLIDKISSAAPEVQIKGIV